jgi:hypothetical protein
VISLIEKVKSRKRAHLIEENLEGCIHTAVKTMNLVLKDYSSESRVKYHTNN